MVTLKRVPSCYRTIPRPPGMDGLFGKLVKAVAKPFTKIFKPKTLLGKVMDPAGLLSRNLKHTMKAADVVGTAVATFYTAGLAAGAGGGFWATTGAGAKLIGGAALKGAKLIGSGVKAAASFVGKSGVASAVASAAMNKQTPTVQTTIPAAETLSTLPATDYGSYGSLSTVAGGTDSMGLPITPQPVYGALTAPSAQTEPFLFDASKVPVMDTSGALVGYQTQDGSQYAFREGTKPIYDSAGNLVGAEVPVIGDSEEKTDWTPILIAGGVALALVLMTSGKKGKEAKHARA